MREFTCHDCRASISCGCKGFIYDTGHSHFVMGAVRCEPCADKFRSDNATRKAKEERERRESHLASGHEDGEVCSECCDHEFDASEGYTCISCGADGSESVMAHAFDRMKSGSGDR